MQISQIAVMLAVMGFIFATSAGLGGFSIDKDGTYRAVSPLQREAPAEY